MVNIADVKILTMKKTMIWTSMLLILSGCHMADGFQDEQEVSENVYKAVMEGFSPDTKTELDANKILWSSGDRITVFDGNDTGKPYLLDPASAGSPSGEFTVTSGVSADGSGDDIDAVVAVYPHSSDLNLSKGQDGTLILGNVLFPSEQQYVPSSFARASFPMVSVTSEEDKELQFLNLGGVLHLSVRGKGAVSRIILEGNAGELISGSVSVSLEQGSRPVIQMDDSASKSVTLVCTPSVNLSVDQPVGFYIALPPVEFSSGLSVTLECEDGEKIIKSTDKPNSVKRSTILKMPEFSLSDMNVECVDLGLSVKWAAWNVGARKPEDYGGYYAWGEIEEKASYSKANYVHYDPYAGLYSDIGVDISGTEYDVAAVKWGDGWRMPTMEELQELASACTWTKTNVGGVNGHNIEGPSGNSIFIPNTGYWQGTAKYFADDYMDGNFGYCWSATLSHDNAKEAYILNCGGGVGEVVCKYWDRRLGLPVRPVKD